MRWTQEAQEALSKVPFFVRKRVRKRVEEEALRSKEGEVTIEHVRACQRRFLERMEEEVKGYQVETCFGPSGCPNRAVSSQDLASRMEKLLCQKELRGFLSQRVGGPLKLHHEFRVSISDCPNACSRPQIADVGLIGARKPVARVELCNGCGACLGVCREEALELREDAVALRENRCLSCGQCIEVCSTGALRQGPVGYRILLGGKLGRHPRLGTELDGIHSEMAAMAFLDRVVDLYKDLSLRGERLGEILERVGWMEFSGELLGRAEPRVASSELASRQE